MFEHLHDFINAALPWVAGSVILAVVMSYSDFSKDKGKTHEK